MKLTYMNHLKRINFIRERVRNLIEIWECDYNNMVKNDVLMNSIVKEENDLRLPLNPRDALSGGRTETISLYHEGVIDYIDFTSLYPYVQKYGKFPIGHPEIITENFQDLNNYFGLIYCKVLPPRQLYLPVLPYHANGKLLFPLCAACAKDQNNDSCLHSDEDRCLESTWVSLELNAAVNEGYKIVKIYEVWNWSTTEQYDTITKEGGLFTSYVNTMLKIKQEASGYPTWVQNDTDADKYISNYYTKEGIQLDKSKIVINSGLKALSKFFLKSQWGRYAMQTLKTVSKFVKNIKNCPKFVIINNLKLKT